LDYLYRNNSGAFVFPGTATHKRRFFKAGAVGAPDIQSEIEIDAIGDQLLLNVCACFSCIAGF
jgi:hypothetical protein